MDECETRVRVLVGWDDKDNLGRLCLNYKLNEFGDEHSPAIKQWTMSKENSRFI